VCAQILSGADEPFLHPWKDFIDRISAPGNERPELHFNTYPATLLDLIRSVGTLIRNNVQVSQSSAKLSRK
jgi:hypothetical protein